MAYVTVCTAGRWKGMVPDVIVLCMVVMFGVSVIQRVYHAISHDVESTLRGIYERTGLLLDISILGLQVFCKFLNAKLEHFAI